MVPTGARRIALTPESVAVAQPQTYATCIAAERARRRSGAFRRGDPSEVPCEVRHAPTTHPQRYRQAEDTDSDRRNHGYRCGTPDEEKKRRRGDGGQG